MTKSLTPTVLRHYLTRKGTDVRKSSASIEQVFHPDVDGWQTLVDPRPITRSWLLELARRGFTIVAIGHNVGTKRVRADFSIKELLAYDLLERCQHSHLHGREHHRRRARRDSVPG